MQSEDDAVGDELKNKMHNEEQIAAGLSQPNKYRKHEICISYAKTICKLAEEFNLVGDFTTIRMIAEQAEKVPTRTFDDSVMKTSDIPMDITEEKINCLDVFINCKPLVKWLQESKTGLNDLKTFVDLALMSAGDDPINIAIVQSLHSAVTCYAPLIFQLHHTAGYKELLKLCSIVWKELEANHELPQKLFETNSQLNWFNEISAHGFVKFTSLRQAESINESGTYILGKTVWKRASQDQLPNGTSLMISDVLSLKVHEKKETILKERFTFTQLQNLRDLLMVVACNRFYYREDAGCQMNIVDSFTSVFDSITRLSKVYIKLWSSGCLLFREFSAIFRCNTKQPVCISLEFGEGKQSTELKGRRSTQEDLKEMIPDVAKFMENCLEKWLNYLKEQRKQFFHLNYFTIDQLVILQRELVKIGIETPSHLIYPMLSAVLENCSQDDLLKATKAAQEDLKNAEQFADLENDIKNDEQLADLDYVKKKFVVMMLKCGFSEELALRALKHVDAHNLAEGLKWCFDHEEEEVEGQEKVVSVNESQDEKHLMRDAFTGMETRDEVGSKPLLFQLEQLWKMFLQSSMQDYLSLEHLGLILRHLASTRSTGHQEVNRSLPPGLKEGLPNLIVCPSADVLFIALTVYQNQHLPLSDEILLCTENTTKDEVDVFWRRALFDCKNKIHCLVNADMLSYAVSEDALENLEDYLQEVSKDAAYRLIVICGLENEYKSRIVSSLDEYRRQTFPYDVLHLRKYLTEKLKISDSIGTIKPAAFADKCRSSVRVIKSKRAGVGKSLFKKRREEDISSLNTNVAVQSAAITIPLHERIIDLHDVIGKMLEHTLRPKEVATRLFHIDISHEVLNGVDFLLFNMLVLGCLMDKSGYVWRKSPYDLYLIEVFPLITESLKKDKTQHFHPMLAILPDLTCRSPQESLDIYHGNKPQDYTDFDQLFDDKQFRKPIFQRPFQYLRRLDEGRPITDIKADNPEGSPKLCLTTLLKHCGVKDPSWSELHHFVRFLNIQLKDYEKNMFVSAAAARDLPGFAKFVLLFLIQMSKDFSSRSLDMREESPELNKKGPDTGEIALERMDNLSIYAMRRTWERSTHPYLFFNTDGFTFTFLGFNIDRISGNLIDLQTKEILEKGIMKTDLFDALIRNKVDLRENFDVLSREEKIQKLCNVMGIEHASDPDDTYELTTDNVKKIMAIYMRFRCDIPVIIMGETGCGKTRLIKFMCDLQIPPNSDVTNMILMKIHGATTEKDIISKVREAEKIANDNVKRHGKHLFTVLFFDEANKTEAVGLIKEIMCDKILKGEKIQLCENLKMVAACNPYRKHSDERIKKIEKAGSGFHVDADETTDRFGRIPMRHLVYRVQPLPQSLLPLVWDFGQLNTKVEELYIRQMVRRNVREGKLPNIPGLNEVLSAILTASHDYMREQKDECSFVSLRDVDRAITVMNWFYKKCKDVFKQMDCKMEEKNEPLDDITRCLILAIGVCYHACLKTRSQYRAYIVKYFKKPCELPGGADRIKKEIECCQEVFLDNVILENMEKNITQNMALQENVFMMVVCIELRIPIFLVGKPGSSKSLAKSIVSDAMQGNSTENNLFRKFKQVQMISFQCSPLSTSDEIVGTFRKCAQYQVGRNLDSFVSVVVLDEVGLAEDSPKMPLKALQELLEDGCHGHEIPEKYRKVGFVGISHLALDPAKMNRGILVQREEPDLMELINIASGLCSTHQKPCYPFRDYYSTRQEPRDLIEHLIEPMAKSYLEIYDEASAGLREFYGLRDFYSLVKMVCGFVEESNRIPTWNEMQHAIRRNFGGLDLVKPETIFKKNLIYIIDLSEQTRYDDMFRSTRRKIHDSKQHGLIKACLSSANECRYLLLLSESYNGALLPYIIQQMISWRRENGNSQMTIYGSSFKGDQDDTEVCRNINNIMLCMETGKTVILLGLENLYECLYDLLNQYYEYFRGQRYVNIGFGTNRVKCPVHRNFRLIIIAEKETVYKKFPISLINRLEKHLLSINAMLPHDLQNVAKELQEWLILFVSRVQALSRKRQEKLDVQIGDVFIGYHKDACSAIVLDVWESKLHNQENEDLVHLQDVFNMAKYEILRCATPESLLCFKNQCMLSDEQDMYQRYFKKETYDSLVQYLVTKNWGQENNQLIQVTTHSQLLTSVHKKEIEMKTGASADHILLLENLSWFETKQQFTERIKDHLVKIKNNPSLMIIQCESGDVNAKLIACAQYSVRDELQTLYETLVAHVHVIFIVRLPRRTTFNGFQCGLWQSIHIDELYPEHNMPSLRSLNKNKMSVAKLFSTAAEMSEDDDFKIRLFVKSLVLKCVQGALSVVRNKDGNNNRATQRVALVRKLLQKNEDDRYSFVQGIIVLLSNELQNFDNTDDDWIVNQAAVFDNLTKSGSLSRSCLQILEGKVTPILTGIIAYLDTNDNLSILEDSKCIWQQDLWFSFLYKIDAYSQYSDMLSQTKRANQKEVQVMTTGCEGQMFSARMPFSWIIIQKIRDVIRIDFSTGGKYETDVDVPVNVLASDDIGCLLAAITDEQSVNESVQNYIEDFVHTVYHASSANEYKLVVQFLRNDVNRRLQKHATDISLLHGIVHVHIAYKTYSRRLSIFHTINSIWTNCSSTITELQNTKSSRYIFKDLTFSALKLLIESVTPIFDVMNTPNGRAEWLDKVQKCRPVVETVISIYAEDARMPQSERCILLEEEEVTFTDDSLYTARKIWGNILVIKLCLEHLFTDSMNEETIIFYCKGLWKKLQWTDPEKSLAEIEVFLEKYNQNAMEEYGFSGKCKRCEMVLDGPANVLPCSDIVCDLCADELISNQIQWCRQCKVYFPDGWQPLRQNENLDALREMQDSQKRCNTFFMEVVSQLCFVEDTAPSQEIIQKLLSYVFFTTTGENKRTRQFTIFKTGNGLDPNPVFRSFLLQLLTRSRKEDLLKNLSIYLDKAKNYIRDDSEKTSQYVTLGVLVIQCLEHMLTLKASKVDDDEVSYATEVLKKAMLNISDNSPFVDTLYGIANARVGLAYLAKVLVHIVDERDPSSTDQILMGNHLSEIYELSKIAQQLYEGTKGDNKVHHVRNYLVKVICRRYGVHVYQALCRNPNPVFEWINITDIKNIVEVPDRYVMCGGNYTIVRESVTKVVLGADIDVLKKTIEDVKGKNIEMMLQLAIHREVTCSYLYPEEERRRKVDSQSIKHLQKFITNSDVVQDKPLLQAVLQNNLVPRRLVVQEGADLRHQGIQSLVFHFMAAVSTIQADHTLLQPLKLLMNNPGACDEMFLPTMPQDDLEYLKATLSLRQTNYGEKLDRYAPVGGEEIVFYRCPNGHPYAIGDCGRASSVWNCYKCGAEIGGTEHDLLKTNVKDAEAEAVKEKGHILGEAGNRVRGPEEERTMNPTTCAVIRLFVHLSMYIGAGNNDQGLLRIISPAIKNISVEDFVWTHIEKDITDIQTSLERSEDDVFLLMHTVIVQITKKYTRKGRVFKEVCQLTTKHERQKWEDDFFTSFLQEPLKSTEILLKTNTKLLADDKRLGGDLLLQLLYEDDIEHDKADASSIQNNPTLWRFSTPISIASLRQEVMSLPKDRHVVLQLFLKEEHHLRALRYIPSILRLHRILINKYQRRLDKHEASQITVAQLTQDTHSGEETKLLILDFAEAWELVRNSLKQHTCSTEHGWMVVSEELCQRTIDDTTPISVLLPTTKEKGLCSYALLHFLFMKQNDFLDRYLIETGRSTSSIETVSPKDVTTAHLISFDPQYDIKALLLANCQYAFEPGKGTNIEYDLPGFEKQLIDRLFLSKSRIDISKMIEIDLMVYSTEFTNSDAFNNLSEKIQQDVLKSDLKTWICSEFNSLPDLCQSLNNLDITISFLASMGGNRDSNLHAYMSHTLQMETTIHSVEAQTFCKFSHIKALWLLLSHQKSKMMAAIRQNTESIFESVSSELHADLPDELQVQLREYTIEKLSSEKLSQLLEVLHEFILLFVTVKQNPNDEDYIDKSNFGLRDCLESYAIFDEPPIFQAVLDDFPRDILYKHSVHTWMYAFRHLEEKQMINVTQYEKGCHVTKHVTRCDRKDFRLNEKRKQRALKKMSFRN